MARSDDGEDNESVQWVVWGALLVSMLIYGGLAHYLEAFAGFEPGDGLGISILPAMLGIVALIEIGVAFWVRKGGAEHFEDAFTPKILSWALAESVSIYGFILWFVGSAGFGLMWAFVALGAATMLLLHPNV
jgi:hypothetical protein